MTNTRGNAMITAGSIDVGSHLLQQQTATANHDPIAPGYAGRNGITAAPHHPPNSAQFQSVATGTRRVQDANVMNQGGFQSKPAPPPPKRGRPPRRAIDQYHDPKEPDEDHRKPAPPKKARLQRESSSLRRSGRVRNKKVTYAESEGSSIHSRERSLEKSETSWREPSASPEKSEASLTYEMQEVRKEAGALADTGGRGGGRSLGNLIAEWHQQGGRVRPDSVINERPPAEAGVTKPMMQKYEVPQREDTISPPSLGTVPPRELPRSDRFGMLQAASSQRPQMPHPGSYIRPPTRRGPPGNSFAPNLGGALPPAAPNFLSFQHTPPQPGILGPPFVTPDRRHNVPNPYQGEQYRATQPAPIQSWLINTPAFNMFPGPTAVPNSREDVVQYGGAMGRNDNMLPIETNSANLDYTSNVAPDFNYNRMHRSFNAAAGLTPPPGNMNASNANTDPKKRPLPASSPGPISKKRGAPFSAWRDK